jgi:pimeloyl-ACP methyl ester carboxylesterase
MTKISATEKIIRSAISIAGFPLSFVQASLSKNELEKHTPPGKITKIGTHSLHAIVTGRENTNHPTIILESGMGGCSLDWSLVQPELAKHTRVISYDRAGFGWSTETVDEPTCKKYVADLRSLLSKLGLAPPYLLVGHSYGGMIMRLFASEHPEEVIGIVLVDSTHEKRYLDSYSDVNRQVERDRYQNKLRLGYILSPIAIPRLLKQHIGSKRLPLHFQTPVHALGYRNNAYKAAYLEFLCTMESALQLEESLELNSELPVIVLSAGRQSEGWKEDQKKLLSLTKNVHQITIEDSWHSIQIHNPKAVVDSILCLFLR